MARIQIAGSLCPEPAKRNFYLSGIDTVTQPRPFAETLQDRGIHYHPNRRSLMMKKLTSLVPSFFMRYSAVIFPADSKLGRLVGTKKLGHPDFQFKHYF